MDRILIIRCAHLCCYLYWRVPGLHHLWWGSDSDSRRLVAYLGVCQPLGEMTPCVFFVFWKIALHDALPTKGNY